MFKLCGLLPMLEIAALVGVAVLFAHVMVWLTEKFSERTAITIAGVTLFIGGWMLFSAWCQP